MGKELDEVGPEGSRTTKKFFIFFFFRKKKIEREARDAIVAKYANKADQLERSILAEERQKVPFLVPFF